MMAFTARDRADAIRLTDRNNATTAVDRIYRASAFSKTARH